MNVYDEKEQLLNRLVDLEDMKVQAERNLMEVKKKGMHWLVKENEEQIEVAIKEKKKISDKLESLLGKEAPNRNLKISKFQIDSGLSLLVEDSMTFELVWGKKYPSEVEYLEFIREVLNSYIERKKEGISLDFEG